MVAYPSMPAPGSAENAFKGVYGACTPSRHYPPKMAIIPNLITLFSPGVSPEIPTRMFRVGDHTLLPCCLQRALSATDTPPPGVYIFGGMFTSRFPVFSGCTSENRVNMGRIFSDSAQRHVILGKPRKHGQDTPGRRNAGREALPPR